MATEFVVTDTTHGVACQGCAEAVTSAIAMARVTGSVGSSHDGGNHAARVERRGPIEEPFFYVYRVPGRADGLEYAVHASSNPGQVKALFALAIDCQTFVDALRAKGHTVSVLPTASVAVS